MIERDQLLHIDIIPQKISRSINMDIYYSGHFEAVISFTVYWIVKCKKEM